MLDGQTPRDPRAAIVADDRESVEAERAHDLDLIHRHRALRVIAWWFSPLRGFAAVAVAAQVCHHDGVVLRETRRRSCATPRASADNRGSAAAAARCRRARRGSSRPRSGPARFETRKQRRVLSRLRLLRDRASALAERSAPRSPPSRTGGRSGIIVACPTTSWSSLTRRSRLREQRTRNSRPRRCCRCLSTARPSDTGTTGACDRPCRW